MGANGLRRWHRRCAGGGQVVIAAADAIGRGAWDWWIVAGLVVAVLVAQVVAVVTRGPLGKEGDSDE